ncbi:NADH-quinone oxidoreductase subunit NuoK [Planctomicrobium sp. SH661]|uniref:NADH-quinone oxidoreductase subunit NuoK n=1 Tax=Planctomicrobium sp. SH661 TaxID=3448124 RepID=UPI003F5AE46F
MGGDAERYLVVGAALFVLGALGFLTRRNLIMIVLSAELMLHGVSLTLVTFGRLHNTLEGQAFTIFALTVAACEAGLALALILALFQQSKTLDVDFWSSLREPDLPGPQLEQASTLPAGDEQEFPRLAPAGRAPVINDGELPTALRSGVRTTTSGPVT